MKEGVIESDTLRDIYSTDQDTILKALGKIRNESGRCHDNFLSYLNGHTDVIKRLVEILAQVGEADIQFKVVWIIINITAGWQEQVRLVVEAGAVPLLIGLLQSRDDDHQQEQAAWALANIIGEDHQNRGYVLSCGIADVILNIIQSKTIPNMSISFLNIIAWIMCNLCRHRDSPQPVVELTKLVPLICRLIKHRDTGVKLNALWALAFLTEKDNELVRQVSDLNVVPTLIQLLNSCNKNIQEQAFTTIRNIMTVSPTQKERILRCYDNKLSMKMKQDLDKT